MWNGNLNTLSLPLAYTNLPMPLICHPSGRQCTPCQSFHANHQNYPQGHHWRHWSTNWRFIFQLRERERAHSPSLQTENSSPEQELCHLLQVLRNIFQRLKWLPGLWNIFSADLFLWLKKSYWVLYWVDYGSFRFVQKLINQSGAASCMPFIVHTFLSALI